MYIHVYTYMYMDMYMYIMANICKDFKSELTWKSSPSHR